MYKAICKTCKRSIEENSPTMYKSIMLMILCALFVLTFVLFFACMNQFEALNTRVERINEYLSV